MIVHESNAVATKVFFRPHSKILVTNQNRHIFLTSKNLSIYRINSIFRFLLFIHREAQEISIQNLDDSNRLIINDLGPQILLTELQKLSLQTTILYQNLTNMKNEGECYGFLKILNVTKSTVENKMHEILPLKEIYRNTARRNKRGQARIHYYCYNWKSGRKRQRTLLKLNTTT